MNKLKSNVSFINKYSNNKLIRAVTRKNISKNQKINPYKDDLVDDNVE